MPSVAARTSLLAQVPLLDTLNPVEASTLLEHAAERHYHAGEVLFCEGDRCAGLHVILAGHVKICKTSASGREIALYIESAPGSIAEVPVFDGGPYPATAFAVDEVTALVIERESFQRLCSLHPEVPCKLLAAVGRRMRSMVALIESLTFGGVRQQLARLLLEFRAQAGDDTIVLPTSTHEIAMRLGTAREVVSRNMSRFQAHGLIRIHRREVVILDPPGLRREAETEF